VEMLPAPGASWWQECLEPAPGWEEFVNLEAYKAAAAGMVGDKTLKRHENIDRLRTNLMPISLNLWLKRAVYAKIDWPANVCVSDAMHCESRR